MAKGTIGKALKRRWWQRLIRLGAAVALLLCAVYVSIPWLLPAEAIRQSLERQMSTDLGAAVRIGGMEISWTKGVVLHKIAIDSPAGFESPPMVQVDRVAAELSPFSLLFNKQLDLLSIDGLQLLLEVNAAGQLNLATLQNFSGDVQARQVSVRNGRATIQLPGQEPIYLKISNLDFTVSSEQPLAALLVSAQLEQKDTVAPLSFRMNAGSGDPIVALARLDFANVELDQLPLIDGLKLPLRKLAGRCAGSAELEVDRSGMVSDIRGNVRASELDAQPLDGPELPVIEQAGLGARASFDPITGQVRIHQLEVRLPGVELAGSAEMTADLYEGYWEAIRSVDLTGRLQPASLAGLLTGKPSLPLGLELTGPVTIHVGGQYDGTLLGVDFSAQANAAIVSRNGLTVKPVGEALNLDLKASLDRRNWQLTVEKNDLVLGSNHFSGTGTISDLRQLVRSIASGDRQLLASQLALLEGSGSWEIRDLQPLQPLLGQPRWLENTGLSGPISGRWLIDRRGGSRVQIWAEAAADRRIMIGDIFAQPPDTPVSLNLTGTISTDQPGLRNIALDLAVGKGLFSIDKGQMLLEDVEEKQTWKAKAQYELTAIESLLDALPLAAKQTVGLQGNITGSFDALLSPIEQKFTATASLAAMEMYIDDYFYKPLNEESNLTLSAIRSADAEPTRQNRLELSGRLPWASAHATASWPDNDNSSAKLDARLDIADAQELPTAIPALAAVQLDRMDGKATIQLSADVKPNVWDYKATLDATDMNVVFAGDKQRSKTADVPATMSLKGSLTWADGEITSGRVDDSTLKLGQSEIALHCDFRRPSTHSGRSELVEDRPVANDAASRSTASQPTSATDFETVSVPRWADFDYNLDLQGRCVLDWPARDLLPELAEAADRFGLDGSASVALNWSRAAPGRRFVSRLDASNLIAADVPLSFNLPGQKGSSATVHLRKPAGLPCELLIEATSPSRSGHEMLVNNLRARAGEMLLVADGKIRTGVPRDREDANHVQLESGHLSISCPRLGELKKLFPALESYNLDGAMAVEGDWTAADGGRLSQLEVELAGVTGRSNGKNFLLNGRALAKDVQVGSQWKAALLRCDGLEFRAGDNHGWLVADLRDLPTRPVGQFQLLAARLDDKDLADWLSGFFSSGEKKSTTAPASTQPVGSLTTTSAATTTTAPKTSHAEIDRQRQAMLEKANKLVEDFRSVLMVSNLDGRISIDNYRTYDGEVDRCYEAYNFDMKMLVFGGQAELEYAAGVNGGVINGYLQTDLTATPPIVSCVGEVRGILADENIQPQLAKFFPGNTVFGTFNRSGKSTAPLSELTAQMLSAKFKPYLVGSAKTVTVDGLLQGRAVPKFVTHIFPGLNLTRYRYDKMTSFAEFKPDGSTINDMVFSGSTYDIYIEGTTDRYNIGRYEIGLILLGTPQSAEWNHTYRQGRIPLLKVKARIEGGKMHDEEVSFIYPNELLFQVFLKNNIFYRIWLASRKGP